MVELGPTSGLSRAEEEDMVLGAAILPEEVVMASLERVVALEDKAELSEATLQAAGREGYYEIAA